MLYVRATYGVPAKRGMKILFRGEKVWILSAAHGKLKVRRRFTDHFWIHPTWRVDYLDGLGERG